MTASTVDPRLRSIAAELPRPHWSTTELLTAATGHLSDRLADMLDHMGVHKRHSVLANYPDVLFHGAEPRLDISATGLAVRAARSCLAKADVPVESVGLVLGVTTSPGRLLPSLVCDLFAQMPELPRTAANLSVAYMGCSALAKVLDTVRWFLTCHPDQRALVCFMDAVTPLSPPLEGFYSHFAEIGPEQRQGTVDVVHGFLFGDSAVAMLLDTTAPGPSFGPVATLTNERPEDAELGTVPDGGSDIPVVHGRRLYTLSPDVTPRGAFYAQETVHRLLADNLHGLAQPGDAAVLLLHTGSVRILDTLCRRFGVDADSEAVASSYRILRDYGNTVGCSVPLMLAEPVRRPHGTGLVVTFGLSFSCGAFTVTIPPGGWAPADTYR